MGSNDRVVIPIGNRLISLTRDEFAKALDDAEALDDRAVDVASRAQGRVLLDAEATAQRLSVDPSWLLRGARERRLPFYRLGKYVRFDPEEVIAHCAKSGGIEHE